MTPRPNGWWTMREDQRLAWTKLEREREEAQYENQSLLEENKRVVNQANADRKQLRSDLSVACEERAELLRELDDADKETKLAWQWIKEHGQWEEFVGWSDLQREDRE